MKKIHLGRRPPKEETPGLNLQALRQELSCQPPHSKRSQEGHSW
jgi:hypothetical protein